MYMFRQRKMVSESLGKNGRNAARNESRRVLLVEKGLGLGPVSIHPSAAWRRRWAALQERHGE